MKPSITPIITKRISTSEILSLDPSDGTETLANASDVFTIWLDPNFKNYGTNVPSPATEQIEVAVYEIVKNGNLETIFGSFGDDLARLCLPQDKIIQFVKKYREWLQKDGSATLFLFQVGHNKFFVASIGMNTKTALGASVAHFSYDNVWDAQFSPRVVVPHAN